MAKTLGAHDNIFGDEEEEDNEDLTDEEDDEGNSGRSRVEESRHVAIGI
jgi:hypothetical protein